MNGKCSSQCSMATHLSVTLYSLSATNLIIHCTMNNVAETQCKTALQPLVVLLKYLICDINLLKSHKMTVEIWEDDLLTTERRGQIMRISLRH